MTYAAHRISYVFRQRHLVIQCKTQNPFVLLHGTDPIREQLPDTGPVLGQTENAHSTGATVPSGGVTGMGCDVPSLDDLPDLGLVPVDNAAPLVNQPVGPGGRICAVDLHLVVLRASSALLPASPEIISSFVSLAVSSMWEYNLSSTWALSAPEHHLP